MTNSSAYAWILSLILLADIFEPKITRAFTCSAVVANSRVKYLSRCLIGLPKVVAIWLRLLMTVLTPCKCPFALGTWNRSVLSSISGSCSFADLSSSW